MGVIIFNDGTNGSTGGGGVTTANNGLQLSTPTNVQLGGSLLQNTVITFGGTHNLTMGCMFLSDGELSVSVPPSGPTDVVRLMDLPPNPVVSLYKVTGQSSSATLVDYSVPGTTSGLYRVSVVINVRVITAGSILVGTNYTDSAGNARNFTFTTLTAVGSSAYPSTAIGARNASDIVVFCTITGTVIADIFVGIDFLG